MVVLTGTAFAQTFARPFKFGWNAPVTPGVSFYRIYRSTNLASGFTVYTNLPVGVSSFTTPYQQPSPIFWYMTAIGTNGRESIPSNMLTYPGTASAVAAPTLQIVP